MPSSGTSAGRGTCSCDGTVAEVPWGHRPGRRGSEGGQTREGAPSTHRTGRACRIAPLGDSGHPAMIKYLFGVLFAVRAGPHLPRPAGPAVPSSTETTGRAPYCTGVPPCPPTPEPALTPTALTCRHPPAPEPLGAGTPCGEGEGAPPGGRGGSVRWPHRHTPVRAFPGKSYPTAANQKRPTVLRWPGHITDQRGRDTGGREGLPGGRSALSVKSLRFQPKAGRRDTANGSP